MTDIDYCKGTTPDGRICPRRDLCDRYSHYLSLRRIGARHDYPMAWNGGDCPMFQLRKFQGD